MIRNEIDQRENSNDNADQKCFEGRCAPDHVGIESGNEGHRRDPNLAVTEAKLLAKGPRQIRF